MVAILTQVLEETEYFCRWRQEKVAKIVQCGEPRIEEGRWKHFRRSFSLPSCVRNCK